MATKPPAPKNKKPSASTPTLAPKNVEQPKVIAGEAAFADPRTLFGMLGKEAFVKYNPDALVTRKGLKIFDDMLRDDQVKAALAFKKQAVTCSGYGIESPADQEEDWEVTQFVERALAEVAGKFIWKLREILSALNYGYSVTEKIWGQDDNGMIVLTDLKTRKPHDFSFKQDAFGNTLGLVQMSRELPIAKFIIYSYDAAFSNPYGTSDLAAAYRPWWLKDSAYKWMSMLLERLGIPPIFFLYDSKAYQGANLTQLKTVVTNLQAATSGIIPRDSKDSLEVWSPELAGQVSTVFTPAIDMLDRHIARGLLMPGLLGLGVEAQVGSLARSRTHFDVFMLIVDSIRSDLEDLVQEQIVEPLVALNFPAITEDECPKFKFLPIQRETRVELLTAWQAMVVGNLVKATPDDERKLRELMEMPERDIPNDEEYGPPPAPAPGAGELANDVPGNGRGRLTLTDAQFSVYVEEVRALLSKVNRQ